MHIKRLQIRNVRGFGEVDLDFTRPDGSLSGWTVLAGRNGSGKSTLLKAIALAWSGTSKAPSPVSELQGGCAQDGEAEVFVEATGPRQEDGLWGQEIVSLKNFTLD